MFQKKIPIQVPIESRLAFASRHIPEFDRIIPRTDLIADDEIWDHRRKRDTCHTVVVDMGTQREDTHQQSKRKNDSNKIDVFERVLTRNCKTKCGETNLLGRVSSQSRKAFASRHVPGFDCVIPRTADDEVAVRWRKCNA